MAIKIDRHRPRLMAITAPIRIARSHRYRSPSIIPTHRPTRFASTNRIDPRRSTSIRIAHPRPHRLTRSASIIHVDWLLRLASINRADRLPRFASTNRRSTLLVPDLVILRERRAGPSAAPKSWRSRRIYRQPTRQIRRLRRVSCPPKPCQLRHRGDVEQGPVSAPNPPDDAVCDARSALGTLSRAMEARTRRSDADRGERRPNGASPNKISILISAEGSTARCGLPLPDAAAGIGG